MKPLEFKISISVKSHERTAEKYRNCYVAEKHIVQNYKIYRYKILIAQIGALSENDVKFYNTVSHTLLEISRQKSVTVAPGRVGSYRAGSSF